MFFEFYLFFSLMLFHFIGVALIHSSNNKFHQTKYDQIMFVATLFCEVEKLLNILYVIIMIIHNISRPQ